MVIQGWGKRLCHQKYRISMDAVTIKIKKNYMKVVGWNICSLERRLRSKKYFFVYLHLQIWLIIWHMPMFVTLEVILNIQVIFAAWLYKKISIKCCENLYEKSIKLCSRSLYMFLITSMAPCHQLWGRKQDAPIGIDTCIRWFLNNKWAE